MSSARGCPGGTALAGPRMHVRREQWTHAHNISLHPSTLTPLGERMLLRCLRGGVRGIRLRLAINTRAQQPLTPPRVGQAPAHNPARLDPCVSNHRRDWQTCQIDERRRPAERRRSRRLTRSTTDTPPPRLSGRTRRAHPTCTAAGFGGGSPYGGGGGYGSSRWGSRHF